MSNVLVAPEILMSAATDVDGIAVAINGANATAASQTSGLLAAAGDEVSAATSALFNTYAQAFQAVARQAAGFHNDFIQALAAAGNAYAQAEAANTTTLGGAVSNALSGINTPIQSLLSPPTASTAGSTFDSIMPLAADPTTALIMGGTWNDDPASNYVAAIDQAYIQPLFAGAVPKGLFTPEEFWPVTPNLGHLTFNQSVAQGVTLLNNAINSELTAGNKVVVFGFSQSAAIANNQINALVAMGSPHASDVSFVMAADPNNPVGGLLARFPGFYIPFLDVSFNGATPADTPYRTIIYTAQYDGIAHAPQYPLNILSDINAIMGYSYVHGTYPNFTAAQIENAVPLATSPGYAGNTQYYMILTQDLPLVQPIRDIPYIGPPLADLIQPQLRVLVDLGYADYGPGKNYANVPTPAGLFSVPNPFTVSYYLAKGSLQAPYAAAVGIGAGAGFWGPELFPNTYPWVPSVDPGLHFFFGQPSVTALSLLSGAAGNVLHLVPPPGL